MHRDCNNKGLLLSGHCNENGVKEKLERREGAASNMCIRGTTTSFPPVLSQSAM